MPAYRIEFKPSADKARKRLPDEAQRRIVRAVEFLADDPRPAGAVKLAGQQDMADPSRRLPRGLRHSR